VARFAAALPLGRLWAWILRVPGPRHLVERALAAIAARREPLGEWLAVGAAPPLPAPSPASRSLRRAGFWAAQAVIVLFMAALGTQVLVENAFARHFVKLEQPEWAKPLVQYGRFFQGWSMFAPEAPLTDGWIVIDAELEDGRHVDPQTGEPPVFEPADAHRSTWGQFWGSYSLRIASGRQNEHRPQLINWLRAPVRHLKLPASDRIVRFKVEWIGDRISDIHGDRKPEIFERYTVVEWPAPR
jgi:hypothetical protein